MSLAPDENTPVKPEGRTGRMMRELQAVQRKLRRTAHALAFVALVEVLLAVFLLKLWWAR